MSDFAAPPDIGIEELRAHLEPLGDNRIEAQQKASAVCLDTFDGLLEQAGRELRVKGKKGDYLLLLQSTETDEPVDPLRLPALPRFATDLPPSPLRSRLIDITHPRALLPQVTLAEKCTTLALMDKESKTVARLHVIESRIENPSIRPAKLATRLRIEPLRGYSRAARRLQRRLEAWPLLESGAATRYQEAKAKLQLTPTENSSKLRVTLQPEMRADAALRTLLRQLLHTMEINEWGIREAIDTEFLHDFRVSVRRTRSALNQIKGVFPTPIVNRFKREFAWLGAITTPLRDLDVYLLHYPEYVSELPREQRPDLEPLRQYLLDQQRSAHKRLVRHLDSRRYNTLRSDWQRFLDSPLPKRSSLPNVTRPILAVASERIWKVYRRALKEGRAIDEHSPAERLHELRKTCKKLRYLMEFFRTLYPDKAARRAIKLLKQLQDVLGAFQDLEVQQTMLQRFAGEMRARGEMPDATQQAIDQLVNRLRQGQTETRARFGHRFQTFSARQHRHLFGKLFQPASNNGSVRVA
ncbi:MAG: CHAD domain-containing protein [Gammaproteobacteria bacterium]